MASVYRPRNTHRLIYMGLCLVLMGVIVGCGAAGDHTITRIALLAPFEGRYREVGYNSYYAALLALNEVEALHTELLAVDDGGSPTAAAERAAALARDPLVKGVIALGYDSTSDTTQLAYADLPVLIVGFWSTTPVSDRVFILSQRDLATTITTLPGSDLTTAIDLRGAVIGSDIFALEGFRRVNDDWRNMVIVSSGRPPEPDFRNRYAALGRFVPQPGLLATLTYDAVRFMLGAAQAPDSHEYLVSTTHEGINGTIHFEDGYWAEAPLHIYRYEPECGAPGNEICFIPVPAP